MGFVFSQPVQQKETLPQNSNEAILNLLVNLNENPSQSFQSSILASNNPSRDPSLINSNNHANQVANLAKIIQKLTIRHQNKIQRIEIKCAKNIQMLETQFTNVTHILQQELIDSENELSKYKLNSTLYNNEDTMMSSFRNTSDISLDRDPGRTEMGVINSLKAKLEEMRSNHHVQINDYETKMFKTEQSVGNLKRENSLLKKDCEVNKENHKHALKLLAKAIHKLRFDTDDKKKQNQNYDPTDLIHNGLQELESHLERAMQQQENFFKSHQLKLKTIESNSKNQMEKMKIVFKEEKHKLLKVHEKESQEHKHEIHKLQEHITRLRKDRDALKESNAKSYETKKKQLQGSIDINKKHEETISSLKSKFQNQSDKNTRLVEHISTAEHAHSVALNEHMKDSESQIAKLTAAQIETMQKNKIAIQQWKDASLKNAKDHNNILKQKTDEHAKEMQLAEDKLLLANTTAQAQEKKLDDSVARREKLINHIEKLKIEYQSKLEEQKLIIKQRTSEHHQLKEHVSRKSLHLEQTINSTITNSKESIAKLRNEMEYQKSCYMKAISSLHNMLTENNIPVGNEIIEDKDKIGQRIEDNIEDLSRELTQIEILSMESRQATEQTEDVLTWNNDQSDRVESKESVKSGDVGVAFRYENSEIDHVSQEIIHDEPLSNPELKNKNSNPIIEPS